MWAGAPACFARLRQTWPMTSEPASQPTEGTEIWVICGNACAGKTTTARLLARRLSLVAHVDGDEMKRLIVSGCRWSVRSDSDPGVLLAPNSREVARNPQVASMGSRLVLRTSTRISPWPLRNSWTPKRVGAD